MDDGVRKQMEGEVEEREVKLQELRTKSEILGKGLSAANTEGYVLLHELRQKEERLEKQIQAYRDALEA